MPTTESITTTYAGEFAGKYIRAALLTNDSITNGAVEVMPNVKFKSVINKLEIANAQTDATCDFDPVGTVTLTERILEPKSLQINLQVCKTNYRDTWEAVQMGYSAHDNLAPNFQEFLLARVAAEAAHLNEQRLWVGAAANTGQYNGLSTVLSLDPLLPSAQELTVVSGGTVSAANVIAEVERVINALPTAVYALPDTKIRMASNVYRAYVAAQAALGQVDIYHDMTPGQRPTYFQGVQIVHCPGLAANTMIAGPTSDLYFGTGLLSDHNEVTLIDMAKIDGSQNVRIIMRFTAGTQVGNPENIVTYGITNSAN